MRVMLAVVVLGGCASSSGVRRTAEEVVWRSLGAVMANKSHVVVRIGSRKLAPEVLKRGLTGCAQLSGRKVKLMASQVTEIRKRQTDAFRPGTKGCVVELDCHFQFIN